MSDDRRLDVLRAIVEDYVATQEPVGSKALVERHHLGVSPATIRNDMAVLEDEGYIAQPHTSAGRVPTDKGYRMFVDRLATVKALSAAERRAIETFLTGAVDVDDVVQRSVRVLAQLTNQVAIVQYPSLIRSTVRHIEIVALENARVLLVVITSSGRVEQRIVELVETPSEQLIVQLRSHLTGATVGERLPEASLRLAELLDVVRPGRPADRHVDRHDAHARVLQRALRRAHRRRRHGQPRPVRLRLRHRHPSGARGDRGAGRAAASAR